jgi:serine phosphatase RsbU (regulator of sigma subunit)
MRILVGWDHPAEADTIGLFLNIDSASALVTTEVEQFVAAARQEKWDAVLFAVDFPAPSESFPLFEKLRQWQLDAPIIGACQQGEVIRLAKFITNGLHSYIMRDPNGEFIFLLLTVIESALASIQAERTRQLADRLKEEIDSVRRLQESVIPRDLPVPQGYAVAARYEPSQIRVLGTQPVVMAGGDYYDVFALQDHNLILLVGDAAGHGVKACMSIMTMHTLIHMIRNERYQNTGEFVSAVNSRLCDNQVVQDEGGFITLMYCRLNTDTGQLQWTSAGHPMPLLQNLETNEVIPLGGEDDAELPLAIDQDVYYAHHTSQIPPRSRLLLYSDGLAEAFPAGGHRGEQFGEKGIIATLQATRELPVNEVVERLFAESNAFTQGTGRHDDTSLVIVERMA